MGVEERNAHKARRLKDIEESRHPYDLKSKEWLREHLYQIIKSVFVGSLRAVETRLGDGFEGYKGLRSDVLRLGNDALRAMHEGLDVVNVEFIPITEEFKCDGREQVRRSKDGSQESN